MKIALQRAIDRYLGIPACALLSAIAHLRQAVARPAIPDAPRRILVILLSEMGSLVLAQPMFARLRERYPDAELHALLFARNREVLDLLAVMPASHVHTIDDRSLGGFAKDTLRALRAIRRLDVDVVIDCELFARVSAILAYLSGARVRVGFHRHTQEGLYRGSFMNRPVPYNPYRHLTVQLLTLAAAIDSQGTPAVKDEIVLPSGPMPQVPFDVAELREVAGRLHADFPAIAGRRLVLLYPGGGILPIRAWPIEHYEQLARGLLADGVAVAIIGMRDDRPLAARLVATLGDPQAIDLTGYTRTVRHLLALLHRADLLITNDGGPAQFAPLTPIHTIALFGPETPALYGPLGPRSHSLFTALPCSPCLTAYNHRRSPCDGDNQCLRRIAPGTVLAKARALLAEHSGAGTLARTSGPS